MDNIRLCELVSSIFRGDVPDRESFRTWNMGMGLIVAIDAADAGVAVTSGHPVIGRLVESETGEVELVGDWR